MAPTRSPQIPEGPEPRYDAVFSGYQTFHHREPFACEWGGVLPELTVAYETWGELSPARDNAVLLHTGLSASSHARSQSANPEPGRNVWGSAAPGGTAQATGVASPADSWVGRAPEPVPATAT